jgi:hypothetical protein
LRFEGEDQILLLFLESIVSLCQLIQISTTIQGLFPSYSLLDSNTDARLLLGLGHHLHQTCKVDGAVGLEGLSSFFARCRSPNFPSRISHVLEKLLKS